MSRVHAGNDFTCGIVDGGTGLCWGINDQGQLGIPTALYEPSPQIVSEDLMFR
jgi:alpha-tubulin suppressor-like RCC1 family protein